VQDLQVASLVLQRLAMGTHVARRFEDLVAWQRCMELRELVFGITETGRCLSDPEFRSQIRRAAENAPPLIAEGFLRFTPEEFVRYLRMARGELGEIQNRLRHAEDRQYFSHEDCQHAIVLARRAMGTTTALLKSKLPLLSRQRGTPRNRPPR
jgi:four helix bundle protein